MSEQNPKFLRLIKGRYYYRRMVPLDLVEVMGGKTEIQKSLKTKSLDQAIKLANVVNDETAQYFDMLRLDPVANSASLDRWRKAVERARIVGMNYKPIDEIAAGDVQDILKRIDILEKAGGNSKPLMEAVMGTVDAPVLKLSGVLDAFWRVATDDIRNKNDNQIRRWRNPRIAAFDHFIKIVGDKPISALTRSDAMDFRDWWLERLDKKGLTIDTVNKNLTHIDSVLSRVCDAWRLPDPQLFKNLRVRNTSQEMKKRAAIPMDKARQILQADILKGLNKDCRAVTILMAELGAGINEVVGIRPQDFHLNAPIPYAEIVPNPLRQLKNKHRQRQLPLLGGALAVFKAFDRGDIDLQSYLGRNDGLSANVNKYLRNAKLLDKGQSLYSFRHGFEDRMLAANIDGRIRADLMGHKFDRPAYGEGATLQQAKQSLEKITILTEQQANAILEA